MSRRSSRGRKRWLLAAEAFLLVAGFIFLGWAGYKTADRFAATSWQEYRFAQELRGQQPTLVGYLKHVSFGGDKSESSTRTRAADESPVEATPLPETKEKKSVPRKLKRADLIGRIEIDRVKVSAVVKEGVDNKTLSRAVGHVPYTPLPGEKGNVGVAAHRDTFFRGLRDIRQGDIIRMVTHEGIYKYEVDSLRIVWPRNVEVLDPTPDERITLVTCYPFNYVGSAPKRFIVQGKQIGFEQLSAADKRPSVAAKQPKAGS